MSSPIANRRHPGVAPGALPAPLAASGRVSSLAGGAQ